MDTARQTVDPFIFNGMIIIADHNNLCIYIPLWILFPVICSKELEQSGSGPAKAPGVRTSCLSGDRPLPSSSSSTVNPVCDPSLTWLCHGLVRATVSPQCLPVSPSRPVSAKSPAGRSVYVSALFPSCHFHLDPAYQHTWLQSADERTAKHAKKGR